MGNILALPLTVTVQDMLPSLTEAEEQFTGIVIEHNCVRVHSYENKPIGISTTDC